MSRFAAPSVKSGKSCASEDVNPNLTDARRAKLLNLRKREELKDVLMQKFMDKYKDQTESQAGDLEREVSEFVNTVPVTEKNLARLERRVGRKQGDEDVDNRSVSAYSMASNMSRMSNRSRNSMKDKPREGKVSKGLGVHGSSELGSIAEFPQEHIAEEGWNILDQYASHLAERDAENFHTRKREQQLKMRSFLAQQMEERKCKAMERMEEEKRYAHNQQMEMEEQCEKERQKQAELKDKVMRQAAERLEQLKYKEEMVAKNEEMRKLDEAKQLAKIKADIKEEQDRIMKQKESERAAQRALFAEQEMDSLRKQAEAEQKKEDDKRAMAEYNKKVEEEEKKRAKEIEEREARQKKLMDKMQNSVLAQQESKADEDANRAKQQRMEADKRAVELERNKQEKLRDMAMYTQKFLLQQMAEKKEKKMSASELKKVQAAILTADAEEYEKIEEARAQDRKAFYKHYVGELKGQMHEKERGAHAEAGGMSAIEMKMNRPLVDVAITALRDSKTPVGLGK